MKQNHDQTNFQGAEYCTKTFPKGVVVFTPEAWSTWCRYVCSHPKNTEVIVQQNSIALLRCKCTSSKVNRNLRFVEAALCNSWNALGYAGNSREMCAGRRCGREAGVLQPHWG